MFHAFGFGLSAGVPGVFLVVLCFLPVTPGSIFRFCSKSQTS